MAIRSNWRAEAPDLIQIELQQKLRNDFDIVKVEPDSFFHEGSVARVRGSGTPNGPHPVGSGAVAVARRHGDERCPSWIIGLATMWGAESGR